ncbi:MAG: futalosine hydrolase [Bacteroidetes bacterium]|nr:futalosine hydrolase [Bacteroidota bacterium]
MSRKPVKRLLVVAATPLEINPFLKQWKSGSIAPKNWEVDVLITGIGLTATTYSLIKQIHFRKPDLIIQAGVGGCFDETIPLGEVVLVKQEAIADQSVIELNQLKTLFDLQLVPQDQFPYQKGWLINRSPELKKHPLKKVRGISVNEITTDKKKKDFYRKHFNPLVESMEGAALHYVALRENIPFLQLRSFSNYIAERNKKRWNMKASIENLNRGLIRIVKSL